jgi:tetratricopeptide (TPR) repeat protein
MPPLNIEQMMQMAVEHHRSGRLAEAEAGYRQILSVNPSHAGALHLLGVLASQTGHGEEAIELIGRAIAMEPEWAEALNNLGSAQKGGGLVEESIASFRRAIQLKPDFPEAYFNLGNALCEKGNFGEAIGVLGKAIQFRPEYAAAHNNLGHALREARQPAQAIEACKEALRLKPDLAEAYNNLGNALSDIGQVDEAIAAYRRALALDPQFVQAHSNIGSMLREKGRLDEAITAYREALSIRPDLAEVQCNLGVTLADMGKFDEAMVAYDRAVRIQPDHAGAHWNRAATLLLRGDFALGLRDHEWRWQWRDFPSPRRAFQQPQWDGAPLNGRTILIYTEQGFGDAIQFVRYVPMVHAGGGRVILECQSELMRIFAGVEGVEHLIARGDPIPAFDVHCPLMSLPFAFKTSLETIPNEISYLSPMTADCEHWRKELGPADGRLRVGLAWAGNPQFKGDRTRSLKLEELAPLSDIEGVTFFSLQKGKAAEQANNPSKGMELVNLASKLNDFDDTAAAMSLMDLIITTDTSTAHLAGALGCPVLLILQFVPDWRWLLNRQDSPWYPTMRLFRQERRGDWETPIREVAAELSRLCGNKKRPLS